MQSRNPLGIACARNRSPDEPTPPRSRFAPARRRGARAARDFRHSLGDVRRVGPLDGLHCDPPRLVKIAGKKQRLREAREDADAQDIRARPSRRNRATSVLDSRAHVTALDHRRTGDFHDRLGVGRPQLWLLSPRTLRHRKQPLNLDLRAPEHRRGYRPARRQRWVLEQQLGGKPAHPAEKLRSAARPTRTRGRSRRAARPPSRRPQRRRRTRSRPRRDPARGTKLPRGGAAQSRPRVPSSSCRSSPNRW